MESDAQANLTVAASAGMWESIDSGWIKHLIAAQSDTRLRLEVHHSTEILRGLQRGGIDFGLTTEQLTGTEIVSEKIAQLRLALVSDRPGRTVEQTLLLDYVHIDWSTSFNTQLLSLFPDYIYARITVSTARLAANLLIDFPGAAYLSRQMVDRLQGHVALHPVEDAPEFPIPIFASHVRWTEKAAAIRCAIDFLSTAQIE